MPSFNSVLDESLATVLVCLAATSCDPAMYLNRKQAGILDYSFGTAALDKLHRQVLAESKLLGERNRGWRLTSNWIEQLDQARTILAQALEARRQQWSTENEVFGAAWLDEHSSLSLQ